ncbi:MAG: hypothetical protein ABIG93_00520 [archaeon]|nr:hypothetical protein [Nanoarchaeota archaeon]
MATVLDISTLGYFDILFAFLLIFAIFYAILQKTSILGKNMGINGLVAVAVALLAILSDKVVQMINFMAPWFVVVFIFFILLLLVFQIMGAKDTDIALAVKDKAVQWVIIGIGLVIVFAAFATVFGQMFLEKGSTDSDTAVNATDGSTTGGDFSSNVVSIIKNPKVLGLIVLFGIAIFAVALLTY